MVKRIVWSSRAELNLNNTLLYWSSRNKSNSYSNKLLDLIEFKLSLLSEFPLIGKVSQYPKTRILTIEKYLILYRVEDDHILIQNFYDGRME